MYINRLILQYYRGASDLKVNLHPKLNIFYGENGAGKSTLLDASAIMLSWLVNRIIEPGGLGSEIPKEDINNKVYGGSIEIFCTAENQEYNWKLNQDRKIRNRTTTGPASLGAHIPRALDVFLQRFNIPTTSNRELLQQFNLPIALHKDPINVPLWVYYPVNRAVQDISLGLTDRDNFSILEAYDGALTSGASFKHFFEWFRAREDLENELIRDMKLDPDNKNIQFPDPQLETVRTAILSLLPDFKNLTVRRNPLRMEVEKKGAKLTVNQLSDGEKCLMAMIGDLARRLAIANPCLNNPLEGNGIVLIDEIDLHLHPTWQRMIIPTLLKIFPNCQFLISTHSPHILTHVQPENLYMLRQTDKGIEVEQPYESYGKNVDRVLEDLMGLKTTRPDKVKTQLDDLYEEIKNKKLSEAKETVKNIKSEIGEDPELVKAEVLIKRMEIIGK